METLAVTQPINDERSYLEKLEECLKELEGKPDASEAYELVNGIYQILKK